MRNKIIAVATVFIVVVLLYAIIIYDGISTWRNNHNAWRKQQILYSPTVYVTTYGTCYHNLRHYYTKNYAISLFEAQAQHYTPCTICHPPALRIYYGEPKLNGFYSFSQYFIIIFSIGYILIGYFNLKNLYSKRKNEIGSELNKELLVLNDKGISYINDFIFFNKNNPEGYFWRAAIKNQYLKSNYCAIKDLNKAIKINDKYSMAYNYRAQVYLSLKKYINAINDFNKTIELEPAKDKYFNRSVAFLMLGLIKQWEDDFNYSNEFDKREEIKNKHEEMANLFHHLWGNAHDSPGYVKREWTRLREYLYKRGIEF